LRLGARPGQEARAACGQGAGGARLLAGGHLGHRGVAARQRTGLRAGQQGGRGTAAHRRPDQERRHRLYREYDRRAPGDRGLVLDPPRGAAAAGDLFHHHCRCEGPAAFSGLSRQRPGLGAARTARGVEADMRPPITAQGAQRLRAELEELKSVQRPAVINAIAEARAHGDLKENAEYHAAREQQGFIEGRIKQLESELSHAQVIDVSSLDVGDKVVFGATVVLADEESGEEKRYQIVGDLEADIRLGLIAISSPVARALIGKHAGDVVTIEAPGGTSEYEIVEVSYG